MKTLFKSDLLAKEFEHNGYVVLPFLSEPDLHTLKALFGKYEPREGSYHIYSNLEDHGPDVNLYIEDKIREVFQPAIDTYFHNYKIYGGSYLVKGVGRESATALHQDWNIVDERKDISLTVWVPLEDVDEANGCLQVIPGSHQWFATIRSSNIPSLHLKFSPKLEEALVSVPIKAGMGVAFAFNLFHGSKSNQTQQLRKAVHLAMVNSEAETVHYVRDQGKERILKVMCDKNFLYREMFDLAKGKIPEKLNIIESFPDGDYFTLTETLFFDTLTSKALTNASTK